MALRVVNLYFVGGLASNNLSSAEQSVFGAPPAGQGYWTRSGRGFVDGALRYFGLDGASWSNACKFTSEPFGFLQTLAQGIDHIDPVARKHLGIRQYTTYVWGQNFGITGSGQGVALITHSMGCAYSMGLMEKMHGQGVPIAIAIHINPFQPASGACTPTRDFHAHVQTENDYVVREAPLLDWIPGTGARVGAGIETVVKDAGWIRGASPIMRPGPGNPLHAHYHPISQGEAFWFPGGRRAAFGHDQYDRSP